MTIHRHFEDQLQELKGRLVTMGTDAESMIERAVKSLLERDANRLPDVFKTEAEVNQLHIEIDERVINLIALHHPVAADLRLVVMCTKIGG